MAVLAQLLFIAAAILLGCWVDHSWVSLVGIGLLGGGLLSFQRSRTRGYLTGWAGCVLAWAGAGTTHFWWGYYAVICGLIAAAIWLGGRKWRVMAMAWSFLAFIISIGSGYIQDGDALFYFGLLGAITLLVSLRIWFSLPAVGAQVVNTFLAVLIGLPIADFFTGAGQSIHMDPDTWPKYYSYREADGDPSALMKWWNFYGDEQFRKVQDRIFDMIPGGSPAHRLRPNSHGTFLQSRLSINSKGFRGAEIPTEKGDTYRIVALGESTTFGMTLRTDDKPWPELLEHMIRERLNPRRPVEVINAGVPSYALGDNLPRLPKEILPLRPDMIISYHGYNGFPQIDSAIPPPNGPPPPRYETRPLDLLAKCEYRIKMRAFRSHYVEKFGRRHARPANPMQTTFATQYRELIASAQTNGIRLVLANFSMAVNSNSDPRVIEFYRSTFPPVDRFIKANEKHSLLVKQLAAENPLVTLIDTHPHLDGENEKFTDIVHLTQEGRQQLAENIFSGIRDILKKDLNESGK